MKKLHLFVGVALLMGLVLPSWSAAEKIGFIDIREIMMTSDTGKLASEDLKKVFEKSKSVIQERESELKKMKDEIEKQRAILTEPALKEKESDYQKKVRDYQLLVKDANEDLQNRDQEMSKKVIPEILKVVRALGEREKYTMIMDVSTMPIAYWSKEGDLTKRIIEEFNKAQTPKK